MPEKPTISVYKDKEGFIHIKRKSEKAYSSSKWSKEEAQELSGKLVWVLDKK